MGRIADGRTDLHTFIERPDAFIENPDHRQSLLWYLLLFLHRRQCLQGCFLHLFSHSLLLCSFLPSYYMPFPRSTTNAAGGFGCMLQQLCTEGDWEWLCPAWGSAGLFSPSALLLSADCVGQNPGGCEE